MKKGFTLIELLAVIVILAIIALIATPIILGIINDARKESNERSAELYASAVRNAIASYQLTHPNAPTSFSELNIEHDGEVICTTQELYEDGSFYIADCTVNGDEVEYTYGEKQTTQVYKPQYYSWSTGNVGGELPSDAKTTVSDIDTKGYPYYLGLDVDANNKVSAAYACFTKNGTEYCLKGYDTEVFDTEAFNTNADIIKDAFSDVLDTDVCYSGNTDFRCYEGIYYVDAYSSGDVIASDGGYYAGCYVSEDGYFECSEY